MRMTKLLNGLLALFIGTSITCAENLKGQAMVTLHVADSSGEPVPDAKVYASFRYSYTYEDVERFAGMTDTNGIVLFSGKLGPELNISVYKDGWYKSSEVIHWKTYFSDAEIKDGKWLPWNPTLEVVFKEKKNPIPMSVRRISYLKLPVLNQAVGFDLFAGDWVKPYGSGQVADLTIVAEHDYRAFRDADAKFTISFHHPEDGLVRFSHSEYGSQLESNHLAPESGYEQVYSAQYGRKGNEHQYNTCDPFDMNYYFRIRTVVDENNRIVQAYYGKIYKGLLITPIGSDLALTMHYYLNPVSLDRNVEYDMKMNLAIPRGAPPTVRNDPVYFANQP